LSHPSRKTIGLRVPENVIAQSLLEELRQALIGTTLIPAGSETPLNDPDEIRDTLQRQVELVIDGGSCSLEPTTVVDLTGEGPVIVRRGRGDVALFG
jgi:tRNA A37 threonylcarbamoyladenosine synthetase subunit TsaC/SUA5/YrdC